MHSPDSCVNLSTCTKDAEEHLIVARQHTSFRSAAGFTRGIGPKMTYLLFCTCFPMHYRMGNRFSQSSWPNQSSRSCAAHSARASRATAHRCLHRAEVLGAVGDTQDERLRSDTFSREAKRPLPQFASIDNVMFRFVVFCPAGCQNHDVTGVLCAVG